MLMCLSYNCNKVYDDFHSYSIQILLHNISSSQVPRNFETQKSELFTRIGSHDMLVWQRRF